MWNSFPRPVHSDLVDDPCHKGLAGDQLTVQKQSWCIHRPFVSTEQAPKRKSHRKLDNHSAMQQLLGIPASSFSWERSCLVFAEWHCRCFAVLCAQHNLVHRVKRGRAEVLGSCSSVAVSSSLGGRSPLFIQHAKCLRPIVLSSMAGLDVSNLSTLSDKLHDFRKKSYWIKIHVLIFPTNFVWNIPLSKNKGVRYDH